MSLPNMLSSGDINCLQDVMEVISTVQTYDYLEIGSWMGASLHWHLTNDRCLSVTSVDLRPMGPVLDERAQFNNIFQYNVTTQDMLDAFKTNAIPTDKLTCIDGTVDDIPNWKKFDLVFIDAEHTSKAVYYDATHCLPVMKESCIMLFHDAWIVHEGLENFINYLDSIKRPFLGGKIGGCDIYGLAMGELIKPFSNYAKDKFDNWDNFKRTSRESLKKS